MRLILVFLGSCVFLLSAQAQNPPEPAPGKTLVYHDIQTDSENKLLPWNSSNPAVAYDEILKLTWKYWNNVPGYWLRKERNVKERFGLQFPPMYFLFRTHDPADLGIGGGQFAIMLSSFDLYADYSGDPAVLENMKFQADWYIKWGFSDANAAWPNLPFPCNTELVPIYDGDLVLGKDYTQPDKAGEFGFELVTLFKKTGDKRYLEKAVQIADTLAQHTTVGDYDHSPLPFKVNALTGEVGYILGKDNKTRMDSNYCTNWTGALRLFQQLRGLQQGNVVAYGNAFDKISAWLKTYPLANHRWGPYFEDIQLWSDTQINAGLMAWFILDNPDWVENAPAKVRAIQNWVLANLRRDEWQQYGVTAIGEQTVYKMYGQSHTARHASIELRYAELTGDRSRVAEAIRQLNWCTYAVDFDGKNKWPHPGTYEIWWTDGYGDYMRHFLRAMAAQPDLAPAQAHVLRSSSVVQKVEYSAGKVTYTTFDTIARELVRLPTKPRSVSVGGVDVAEAANIAGDSWRWLPLAAGGVAEISHGTGRLVEIEY
ncbi:MAG: hypothetical protein SFV32_05665 [Opitutaceae bacterium]|nr:hypothetical protein [Opitutaceae bacterium]